MLGLECHLAVSHGRVASPGPEYERSGNMLLNELYGAHLHEVAWNGERNAAIRYLAEALKAQGRRPFVVPYGVSNGLGALAYATAAREIAEQCADAGIAPAAIVHCSGSGGTQAGLVLGAAAWLPETEIVGIDIDAEPERVRADVLAYGSEAARLAGTEFAEPRVEVVAGHAGPAYGVPHGATLDAIEMAARLEAVLLDPVYSGKGFAGLIALIRGRRWKPSENVVFLHTGGVPALFAYRSRLERR